LAGLFYVLGLANKHKFFMNTCLSLSTADLRRKTGAKRGKNSVMQKNSISAMQFV